VVIGYLMGRGLDRLFSCYPWCTVIFSTLGVVAGFREVIRIALRVGREEDRAARGGDGKP
jgi:F0F1-type ATP synthase assembly protein I